MNRYDKLVWSEDTLLWKMKIQEYLTCAIQNIQTLIRQGSKPKPVVAEEVKLKHIEEINAKSTNISPRRCFLAAKFELMADLSKSMKL